MKNGEIVIYDMSGKKIDSFKFNKENGTYELNAGYPKGTYLVHLNSENGTAIQKMMIK